MDARDPAHSGSRAAEGLFGALRRMLATLLAMVHTRLELITTELEEEIHRAASILLWALVALFFGSLAVLMLALMLLIVFWETHRVLVAALITAAFLGLAIATALLARARLRARTGLLAASIEQLRRDRAALEERGQP